MKDSGSLVKTNYTFGGWNTQNDGLGTNYPAGSVYTITADTTLYAKWTLNTYSVSFNEMGGSTISNQTIPHGGLVTVPGATYNSGYKFIGWYKDFGCTTPWNFATDTVTSLVPLYAKWEEVTFSVGDDGTSGNPYEIDSTTDLDNMRYFYDTGTYFIQTADIDLGSITDWQPIGNTTNRFRGTFDGGVFTISNLNITGSNTNSGLFGCTSGATIKNVKIVGVNIAGGASTGGLVGDAILGLIEKCFVIGGTINSSGNNVGGLVGVLYQGSVSQCFTQDIVITVSNSPSNVGGLVGYPNGIGSAITACYSTCSVSGSASGVGGLIGITDSNCTVSKSYSVGLVNSGTDHGGFLGKNGGGTITDCFYDTITSDRTDDSKGTPKTTYEMSQLPTFTNWSIANDLSATWKIEGDGTTYPYLSWQGTTNKPLVKLYTITFDKNDVVATGTMSSISKAQGNTLALNAYANGGKNFAGWAESPSGTVKYLDGAVFTTSLSSPVTLYAVWRVENSITATIDVGTEGGIDFTPPDKTVIKGNTLNVSFTTTITGAAYQWYIDGDLQSSETSNTITIDTSSKAAKQYLLSVTVTKDGKIYSGSCTFRVTN